MFTFNFWGGIYKTQKLKILVGDERYLAVLWTSTTPFSSTIMLPFAIDVLRLQSRDAFQPLTLHHVSLNVLVDIRENYYDRF